MKRLILATGIEDLENALRPRVAHLFESVESILFLQALTIVQVDADVTVLLTSSLQNSGMRHIVEVVDQLRRQNVRVVFLGEGEAAHSSFVQALLSRGVYDIILNDDLALDDILRVLERPASYADVAHLVSVRQDEAQLAPSKRTFVVKSESDTEQQHDTHTEAKERRRLFNRREKSVEPTNTPTTIIVTGLPGSGVSYVAVQVALEHTQTRRVALVEASDRPTFVRWLNGPDNDDGANQIAARRTPERAWWLTDTLRVYPALLSTGGPSLKSVLAVAGTLDVDVVVIDARLEDVRAMGAKPDILVVPPDPAKIDHVTWVDTRELVVNMAPTSLPVELEEYGDAWTDIKIRALPWDSGQALAVVNGYQFRKS